MLRIRIFTYLVFAGWVGGCTAPTQPAAFAYRNDESVSTRQGVPRDSTVNYFFAKENLNLGSQHGDSLKKPVINEILGCQDEFSSSMLESASQDLFEFKAPVLSNYFLGHTIYRFLWLRSFNRPVLIVLDRTESGGVLRTKILNKEPGMYTSDITGSDNPLKLPPDELALARAPIILSEAKAVFLSQAQVQHFDELLTQAKFWQLPSCQELDATDGAMWVVEVHEPTRYKVVYRHSPNERRSHSFRQCCDFLLDLSPAKSEKRY